MSLSSLREVSRHLDDLATISRVFKRTRARVTWLSRSTLDAYTLERASTPLETTLKVWKGLFQIATNVSALGGAPRGRRRPSPPRTASGRSRRRRARRRRDPPAFKYRLGIHKVVTFFVCGEWSSRRGVSRLLEHLSRVPTHASRLSSEVSIPIVPKSETAAESAQRSCRRDAPIRTFGQRSEIARGLPLETHLCLTHFSNSTELPRRCESAA